MIRRAAAFLGLTGPDKNLSFNKSVTVVMCAVFAFAVVYQLVALRLPPTWELLTFGTVVIGAGFGLKGYMGAISRQNTNAQVSASSHTDTAAVVKALRAEPDYKVDDER